MSLAKILPQTSLRTVSPDALVCKNRAVSKTANHIYFSYGKPEYQNLNIYFLCKHAILDSIWIITLAQVAWALALTTKFLFNGE
jgi:hypothetical protein